MKNMIKIRRLLLILLVMLIGICPQINSQAAEEYLDEINLYEITVNVREDATLDIRYDIQWHVLSDKDGTDPVTWAIIGIPNKYVDSINTITSNIESAKYWSDGGDFVRVDFKEKYYAGDTFSFAFTIHQSHMYKLENGYLQYGFTAGWFEKIPVKRIIVKWRNLNIAGEIGDRAQFDVTEDQDYLVCEMENLEPGEHFSLAVRMYKERYHTNPDEQYVERSSGSSGISFKALIIIIVVLVLLSLFIAWLDGYSGGFGGGGGYSSGCACASGCACVSSCACACACAGGGRAGCTAKDFYHTEKEKENTVSRLLSSMK